MTRAEIINALIDSDQTFRFDDYFADWFDAVLREGFKGYRNMTDAELAELYADRVAKGHIVVPD